MMFFTAYVTILTWFHTSGQMENTAQPRECSNRRLKIIGIFFSFFCKSNFYSDKYHEVYYGMCIFSTCFLQLQMLQAVTVLRLHLFELEKVNELCRDFCDRYTACLRKNLHTDQILRADSFDLEESPPPNGHPRQPTATAPAARSNSTSSAAYGSPVNITAASGASYDTMGGNTHGLVAQQNQVRRRHFYSAVLWNI